MSVPGDACEREADRIAERVTRDSDGTPLRGRGAPLARRGAGDGDRDRRVSAKPVAGYGARASHIGQALKIPQARGVPLAPSERAYFEPRFGFSFENVRIHGGTQADAAAQSFHARAFTMGSDIWFARGEYRPGMREGRRLLAHELTHTLQQTQLGRQLIQREEGGEGGESPVLRRVAGPARLQAAGGLDRAIERLTEAIDRTQRSEGMPENVQSALGRFFPGETLEFLPLLLRRIVGVRGMIETIRIRSVFRPVDASIETYGVEINQFLEAGIALTPMPLEAPDHIVVFPRFYREAELQATRLIHECFHVRYPSFIRHSLTAPGRENPRANAYSYQGFVSMLGELPQEHPLELFPAPE